MTFFTFILGNCSVRTLQYFQKNFRFIFCSWKHKKRASKVAHDWPQFFFHKYGPAAQTSPELIFHIINMSQQDSSVALSVVQSKLNMNPTSKLISTHCVILDRISIIMRVLKNAAIINGKLMPTLLLHLYFFYIIKKIRNKELKLIAKIAHLTLSKLAKRWSKLILRVAFRSEFFAGILEEFWCYLLHWQIFYQEKLKNKMHQNEKGALSFVFINFYRRDCVRWGFPKPSGFSGFTDLNSWSRLLSLMSPSNKLASLIFTYFLGPEDSNYKSGQYFCDECDVNFDKSTAYARHLYAHTFIKKAQYIC